MQSNQTDFRQYLKRTSSDIEKELNTFSNSWNNIIKKDFSEITDENKKFTDSLYGGKMLRGTLVKLGYELFQNSTETILKPAIAFEILHTSLLIHDDIIDQSPIRRGKPAVHINKNKHYGTSQAICLGDLGITLAIKQLLESDFLNENKNRALNYFLDVIKNTILGEMLDVKSAKTRRRTEEQILKIHHMKTAHYTITGPLSIGAILAGASAKQLESIKQFGENIGIAFQLQDDMLGIFGDENVLGKSTTSDIEENKSTLLITHALKYADTKQKAVLKKYYGSKKITKKQHEMIKQIFIDTGSLVYSQRKVEKLITQAKEIIPEITDDKHGQLLLTQFSDVLIKRKK